MYYFHQFIIFIFFLPLLFSEQDPSGGSQTHPNEAQQTQETYSETVEVDLIDVYLSATDSKGRVIDDLKQEDFILKEDDVVQEISNFSVLGKRESDLELVVALGEKSKLK